MKFREFNTLLTRIVLSICYLIISSWAVTYYVAPDGEDASDGSEAAPFKTLHHARDKLRESGDAQKTVILRGGDYFLESTLTLDENDGGSVQNPVVWKGYPGEEPRIFGGQRITGWESAGGSVYKAYVGSTDWEFWTLSENGEMCNFARHPNHCVGDRNGTYRTEVFTKSTLEYNAGEFPSQWEHAHSRINVFINGWFSSFRPIGSVDFSNRQITLDPASTAGKAYQYIAKGSVDFIDEQGEWALDADGYIHYWPVNTPIEDQVIVAPTMLRIIEFKGSSESNPVKHIIFEGLTLSTSDCVPVGLNNKTLIGNPGDESEPGNCDNDYLREGLVHLENAERITVRYCKIFNAGVIGVMINYHAMYNTIYGNWIDGTGYHGCLLSSYCGGTGPWTYINRNNEIVNNYFHNFGIEWSNGSAIQLYQSGDNIISHNEIRGGLGGRRYGISEKGSMFAGDDLPCGKEPGCIDMRMLTTRNSYTFNDVADVMNSTNDLGSFEAWRTGKHSSLAHNRFHDMTSPCMNVSPLPGPRHAIYLDDAGYYSTIRNVFYNIKELHSWMGTKGFSDKMEFNNTNHVATEAEAQSAGATLKYFDWDAIGVLDDFPWQTPMGKSNRQGYDFSVIPGEGNGVYGEYFPNKYLSGTPQFARIDPVISMLFARAEWKYRLIDNNQIVDSIEGEMSIRWTGKLVPLFSETHTFYAVVNDGVKLWVGNTLVIDEWTDGMKEVNGTIDLAAGQQYDFKMEYYQVHEGRHKGVQLCWESQSQRYRFVPQTQLYTDDMPISANNIRSVSKQVPIVRQSRNKMLRIQFPANSSHAYKLYTCNGQLISYKKGAGRKDYMIPLTDLSSGIYMLKVNSGRKTKNYKVVAP